MVGLNHLVSQGFDLIQVQHRCGQGIQPAGVIDIFTLPFQGRLYRQLLYAHMGVDQRRRLRRQRAAVDRLNPVSVHKAGHFHAAAFRQIENQ